MQPQLLGTFAACLVNDVNPSDFEHIKGATDQMRNSAQAEAFGRGIASLAEEIFVKAGHAGDLEAHLYGQLAKTAGWQAFHYDMLDPVYLALANFHSKGAQAKQAAEAEATIEKSAASLLAAAKAVVSKFAPALTASPGMMMGAAGVAGAGLGSIHWALNRAANGSDADSAVIENQIDNYNELRREISDEIKRNPPPALRAAMRKKLDQAESPGYAL